ncbi:MAG TPA: VWA domain-containing protein [Candidatus Polarisedimenticolia bacterium]|nr:VWA domain-containing protein [Candidatus Polarisedimenticolia bacterium]
MRLLPIPAALLLAAGQAIAGPLAIKIVSPVAADVLLGKTEVVVESTSPGVTIFKMELYANDRLVATLLDPPYTFTWDAGESLKSQTLRVKAYGSEGVVATDVVTTRALQGAQKARVTLVEVYSSVRDAQGRYVTDLGKEDFTVFESGARQEIAVFSAERKPVHVALVLDTSASMREQNRIEIVKEAAAGFIEALEPGDNAAAVAFDDLPRLLQPLTTDKKALVDGINTIEARGGTALYDALVTAVELLKGLEGRKAIILLSDGRDESVDGMGPGSFSTYEKALDAALRSETAIYAIGTGGDFDDAYDFDRRRTIKEILETLAARSGGRSYFVKKASRLGQAYRQIEDELRHQYTLAYYPPPDPKPGKGADSGWRPIEVKVKRPGARIVARSGYYAK